MTPDERQMLANLFERINATGATPRDAQAEAFINDAVRAMPFTPYVLAQTVLVQQQALEAAAQRMSELEAAARQGAEPQQQGSFLGNLGKSLFGGGAPSAPLRPSYDPSASQRGPAAAPGQTYAPPPPQPQAYAAPPPSGPWGGAPAPAGGGFLQNAMSTAAGVAGGVAIGNLLGGLFSGHAGGPFGGGFSGAGLQGGGETINNFYEAAPDRRDMDPAQFDSAHPQDANYDDASYTDDSSYDDGSGGGYDDV